MNNIDRVDGLAEIGQLPAHRFKRSQDTWLSFQLKNNQPHQVKQKGHHQGATSDTFHRPPENILEGNKKEAATKQIISSQKP